MVLARAFPGRAPLEQFPIKWIPVERKKLRQNKELEPGPI
jgi:hypothetical protein